ncbi:unnamed protein product, partial [Darwinula stevensoni]
MAASVPASSRSAGNQKTPGSFCLGRHTLRIPMELHALNRKRLCERLREKVPENAVVLLMGGESCSRDSSDVFPVFRQESYFHWAFGVLEPDCYGAIEVSTGKATLFFPKLHESFAIWDGRIKPMEEFRTHYEVDGALQVHELPDFMTKLNPAVILTLVSRVIKTSQELRVLRYAARVSTNAHIEVMKRARPGMKEYQLEALFMYNCYYFGGCRHVAYTCICGTGSNAAILHYGGAHAPNDRSVNDGDI